MKRSFILMGIILIAFLAVVGMRAINVNAQAYTFNNDLAVGSNGPDVIQLQTWLINNGFSIPAIASGITGKGYFGSQTQAALMAYQRSINLPAYGFFGPMTRQYFNNRGGNNGNNDNPAMPIRITSPNGGESWQRGTVHNITWTSPAYFQATYVDIKLIPYQAPCTTQICPMVAQAMLIRAPYTVATGISANQNSYSWNVGNVSSVNNPYYNVGVGVNTIPDGQYTVQICQSGTSNCVSSNNLFTITL